MRHGMNSVTRFGALALLAFVSSATLARRAYSRLALAVPLSAIRAFGILVGLLATPLSVAEAQTLTVLHTFRPRPYRNPFRRSRMSRNSTLTASCGAAWCSGSIA